MQALSPNQKKVIENIKAGRDWKAERPLTHFDQMVGRSKREGQGLSPLARAALANGVAFDDVYAYLLDGNKPLASAIYEALVIPEVIESSTGARGCVDMSALEVDVTLESALARSVLAQGTIEHARLWWRGVL